MSRALPYPGYTWSFTQHAVGLLPQTLYGLLECAAPFEGHTRGYDQKITELMISAEILTANNRDGEPDAWRDYQQVLAELGLIYSTLICPTLTITELGQMLLAGEIGFSELIGIQALRYQYPNGQKSVIQARQRRMLEEAAIPIPKTLTELQVNYQILIKPGLLILRILLELHEHGHTPTLSVSECQAFLLPCRTNSQWELALFEVIAYRRSPSDISQIHRHSRRNIQDWFKLLQKSDYFEILDGNITLSTRSLSQLAQIKHYCDSQEDSATYWVPTAFDRKDRLNWFGWFGALPYANQELLLSNPEQNAQYILDNFVAGLEEDKEQDIGVSTNRTALNLQSIDLEHLGRRTPFNFTEDIPTLVDRLREGAQKRHAKTLLHDRIVKQLAQAFISQGATVESDPDSIDLFATWPDGNSAIFEVKTVTRRSLQDRMRYAIGQVQEYAYKHQCIAGTRSDLIIVINMAIDATAWQRTFLTDHLGIGLICKPSASYLAYSPPAARTGDYWASL